MCYIYPAVFYKEADGRYSVIFPDLNDLATYGNDFADAFTMAQEAIQWRKIPKRSLWKTILKFLKCRKARMSNVGKMKTMPEISDLM